MDGLCLTGRSGGDAKSSAESVMSASRGSILPCEPSIGTAQDATFSALYASPCSETLSWRWNAGRRQGSMTVWDMARPLTRLASGPRGSVRIAGLTASSALWSWTGATSHTERCLLVRVDTTRTAQLQRVQEIRVKETRAVQDSGSSVSIAAATNFARTALTVDGAYCHRSQDTMLAATLSRIIVSHGALTTWGLACRAPLLHKHHSLMCRYYSTPHSGRVLLSSSWKHGRQVIAAQASCNVRQPRLGLAGLSWNLGLDRNGGTSLSTEAPQSVLGQSIECRVDISPTWRCSASLQLSCGRLDKGTA